MDLDVNPGCSLRFPSVEYLGPFKFLIPVSEEEASTDLSLLGKTGYFLSTTKLGKTVVVPGFGDPLIKRLRGVFFVFLDKNGRKVKRLYASQAIEGRSIQLLIHERLIGPTYQHR